MQAMTVFCSASASLDPSFETAARAVGRALAQRDLTLVYGGGGIGLMGHMARATAEAGGRVIGVITHHLVEMEQAFDGCDELIVVDSMQERKRIMAERGDGFLVLPGGIGTLEEFFETLVGRLLEEHTKPIGIVNQQRFYDPLLAMFTHCIEHRFVTRPTLDLLHWDDDPIRLIDTLLTAEPIEIDPDRFYPARSSRTT